MPREAFGRSGGFVQVLVLIILVVVAGYFAFKYFQLKNNVSIPQFTPTPLSGSVLPTAKPTSQPSTSLPTSWIYKSDVCGVRFPIPPKEVPYYNPVGTSRQHSITSNENSGRFWDFPSGAGTYPNLLSKLLTGNAGYKQAGAWYIAPGYDVGEYVIQAVVVSCINNIGNLDNQGMLRLLNSGIKKYNQQDNSNRMEGPKYVVTSTKEADKWGQKVVVIKANSEEYIMFATPQYIYEAKVFGTTDDSFVKETAQKIFDNLQFE